MAAGAQRQPAGDERGKVLRGGGGGGGGARPGGGPGLYGAVAAGVFRRHTTYRMATAAGVFTNTVFGLILTFTYAALWEQRDGLGGYDLSQALTYVWVGQALLMPMATMGGGFQDELIERIRTGDIAVDLFRPADLQLWWLAHDLGRAAFHLLGRGVVPLLVGGLVFDLMFPAGPWSGVAGGAAFVPECGELT